MKQKLHAISFDTQVTQRHKRAARVYRTTVAECDKLLLPHRDTRGALDVVLKVGEGNAKIGEGYCESVRILKAANDIDKVRRFFCRGRRLPH